MVIDTTTYDKHAAYPPRHGYQLRGTAITSIVVHSTSNSRKNTAFAGEARFLYESADVSAHFLLGKDGRIVQFLDPKVWQAWHVGAALLAWSNARSIGIELHHSVGDPPYPQAQIDTLAELCRLLMQQFAIPVELVETHGQVAIPGPYDRKKDPSDWPHDAFLRWRATLVPTTTYHVKGVPVYQQQQATGPVAGYLAGGEIVTVDRTYPEQTAHLASGLGFIKLDDSVEAV